MTTRATARAAALATAGVPRRLDAIRQTLRGGTAWAVADAPAAAAAAEATQAAPGAGFRNVCTGITVSLSSGAVVDPTPVTFALLDGAGGDALWAVTLALPRVSDGGTLDTEGGSVPFSTSGVRVVASEDTALVLSSGTPGTDVSATVAMSGEVEEVG